MERLRDGDEHAFEVLFDRHAGSIHRFLSRRVDDAQAEDLTQETFLSVIRARGRYLLGRSFRNWLYAVASNAARHHLRANRREGTRLREAAAWSRTAALDEGAGIEERAGREALALLPDAQREVIVLHAYEGMTFAEIADVLGMSAVTVRVRAHRGYRRLRELLARYRGGAMSTGCTRALDSLGDPRALATLRPHLETAPSAVLSSMRRLTSGRSGRLRSTQALPGASARS